MPRCPRAVESGATQRSALLEDSTGASHVAKAGVRVEMMKIESDPNFQKIGSTRNTSLRISNLCFLNAEPQRCAEPQRACKTELSSMYSVWSEDSAAPRLLPLCVKQNI